MVVRVQTARQELEAMRGFDYVVENREGCLDMCADTIGSIIDAEKAKVSRRFGLQQPANAL
jgi:guanylate kinase